MTASAQCPSLYVANFLTKIENWRRARGRYVPLDGAL